MLMIFRKKLSQIWHSLTFWIFFGLKAWMEVVFCNPSMHVISFNSQTYLWCLLEVVYQKYSLGKYPDASECTCTQFHQFWMLFNNLKKWNKFFMYILCWYLCKFSWKSSISLPPCHNTVHISFRENQTSLTLLRFLRKMSISTIPNLYHI
jgi:hypothetical protein